MRKMLCNLKDTGILLLNNIHEDIEYTSYHFIDNFL
jgi:hypothetical protein